MKIFVQGSVSLTNAKSPVYRSVRGDFLRMLCSFEYNVKPQIEPAVGHGLAGTLTPLRVHTLPTLSSTIQHFTPPPAPCHQFALHFASPVAWVHEAFAVFDDRLFQHDRGCSDLTPLAP